MLMKSIQTIGLLAAVIAHAGEERMALQGLDKTAALNETSNPSMASYHVVWNSNDLRFSFRCLKSNKHHHVPLKVQSSRDLGVLDPCTNHEAPVPDVGVTVNGVISDTSQDGDFIHVSADMPSYTCRNFARIAAVPSP